MVSQWTFYDKAQIRIYYRLKIAEHYKSKCVPCKLLLGSMGKAINNKITYIQIQVLGVFLQSEIQSVYIDEMYILKALIPR